MPPAGELFAAGAERCGRCAGGAELLSSLNVAVVYERVARRLLLRAKLGGRTEILAALGDMLAARLRLAAPEESWDCVVAVPSHPARTLRRGFNPAGLIADRVAASLSLPLRNDLLRRRWGYREQAKRMRGPERRARLRVAFTARRHAAERHILLVDDVVTTGSTLGGCARALRDRRARRVGAAVWARTPRRTRV